MGNPTTPTARAPASETIHVNIVVGRARGRLSQDQLAERSAVGRATISRIERGTANDVGVKPLARLANALGLRIARNGSWPSVEVARRYLAMAPGKFGEVVAPR